MGHNSSKMKKIKQDDLLPSEQKQPKTTFIGERHVNTLNSYKLIDVTKQQPLLLWVEAIYSEKTYDEFFDDNGFFKPETIPLYKKKLLNLIKKQVEIILSNPPEKLTSTQWGALQAFLGEYEIINNFEEELASGEVILGNLDKLDPKAKRYFTSINGTFDSVEEMMTYSKTYIDNFIKSNKRAFTQDELKLIEKNKDVLADLHLRNVIFSSKITPPQQERYNEYNNIIIAGDDHTNYLALSWQQALHKPTENLTVLKSDDFSAEANNYKQLSDDIYASLKAVFIRENQAKQIRELFYNYMEENKPSHDPVNLAEKEECLLTLQILLQKGFDMKDYVKSLIGPETTAELEPIIDTYVKVVDRMSVGDLYPFHQETCPSPVHKRKNEGPQTAAPALREEIRGATTTAASSDNNNSWKNCVNLDTRNAEYDALAQKDRPGFKGFRSSVKKSAQDKSKQPDSVAKSSLS